MPRDTNGNYQLPQSAGNPVVKDSLITADWANPTLEDLAQAMQDSLSRKGDGGMQAPLGFLDKSGIVPGFNFVSEPTTGIRKEANEDMRAQVTGTDVWQAIKTGFKVLTPSSGGMLKHPVVEESGQKVMRGVGGTTVLYFYNDTAPTGWTLNAPDANIRELVIGPSGAGQGGQIGGASDPTTLDSTVATTVTVNLPAVVGAHSLTVAELPVNGEIITSKSAWYNFSNASTPSPSPGYPITGTASAGGGGSHDHPLGGTAAGTGTGSIATISPRYARGILGTLDA